MAGGSVGVSSSGAQTTPLGSASYINLPPIGSKQAPPKFTGRHRALERFLVHYESVCAQNRITDDREKCKGIIQYCNDEVAETIESMDSYDSGDFSKLKEDLEWLYDGSRKKSETHRGDIEDFARSWRKVRIEDLEKFKKYHREFIRLAGALKIAKRVSESEYDQYFWSGLHRWTRDRIEKRMTDDEPKLDLSVPFPIRKVRKAAEHIFNRNRFDKYLREGKASVSRSAKSKSKTKRKSRRYEDTDDESYSSSASDSGTESSEESDEEPIATWRSRRAEKPDRLRNRAETNTGKGMDEKTEGIPSKEVRDEIAELTEAMEGLEITQARYRTLYTRLNVLPVPKEILDLYPQPAVTSSKSYLSQGKVAFADRTRDLPPHQSIAPFDQRIRERRAEYTCFGCGESGHRMDQCIKIETLLDQGHIKRVNGRLRWKDGSTISREQDETWAKAILRRIQREKSDEAKVSKVYYAAVRREESDADTDEQEELGWRTGTSVVRDVKAFGAVRTTGVSKETRRKKIRDLPRSSHEVMELPHRQKVEGGQRNRAAVHPETNVDRHRNRDSGTTTPTPVDVRQEDVEGIDDGKYVPMDVEQMAAKQSLDDLGEPATHAAKGFLREIVHRGANKARPLTPITNEVLNATVTLRVRDLVTEYKSARQGLMNALKAMPRDEAAEAERQAKGYDGGEKKMRRERLNERERNDGQALERAQKVMKAEYRGETVTLEELKRLGEIKEGTARPVPIPQEHKSSLPTVVVTIGRLTVEAIIDTGSMVNMISGEQAAKTRIPTGRLNRDAFQLGGILGPESQCVRWIPPTRMYMTGEHLPTVGALFVLDGGSFDVILGMPWLEKNLGSVVAKGHGTYVGWNSDGKDYEVMASLVTALPIQVKTIFVDDFDDEESDTGSEEEVPEPVVALMAKIPKPALTDQSYVPDSEEERNGMEYLEISSEDDESGTAAVEWARGQVNEWMGQKERELGSIDIEDDEPEESPLENSTPPPNQLAREREQETSPKEEEVRETTKCRRKRTRTGNLEEEIIELSREVEDEFSQLVQQEADDEEWKDFVAREGIRISKRDKEWLRWIEDDDDDEGFDKTKTPEPAVVEEVPSESESVEMDYQPGTQGRSETIGTYPEEPENPAKQPRLARKLLKSTKVVARRSTRERRLTEKGRYFADEILGKRRTYRRQETASKTITRRTRLQDPADSREKDDDCIRSYCVRWWPRKPKLKWDRGEDQELWDQPKADDERERRPKPTVRERLESRTLAEVYDAREVPRNQSEEGPVNLRGPWDSHRNQTLRVPGTTYQSTVNEPVIPNLPQDLDWSDDEEIDIIRPLKGMVGDRDTDVNHRRRIQEPREDRVRPDSGAYPIWESAWTNGRPIAEASGSVTLRMAVEPIRPRSLRPEGLFRNMDHESGNRHSPRNLTAEDERRRNRRVTFYVPEEESSPDEEEGGYDVPRPTSDYDTPEHPLRRTRRHTNLRQFFGDQEPGVGSADPTRRRPRTLTVRRPLTSTSGRPSQAEGVEVRVFGVLCQGPEEREICARTVETVGRKEVSGGGQTSIKERVTSQRKTRPSPWLLRVLRRLRLLRTAHWRRQLLLMVSLLTSLIGNLLLTLHQTRTSHPQSTMKSAKPPTDNLPPTPDNPTVKTRLEPFNGQGYDTTNWARNPAHDHDKARALLEHTLPTSPERAIPGLIGVNHLVPFVTSTCPDTLEYLGRGTTVSIRTPNGEQLHHRGDVHVRVFRAGVIPGWSVVKPPSRTELDLLLRILRREDGYGDEMAQILERFNEVDSIMEIDERKKKKDGKDGEDEDDEDEEMTEGTDDEDETMVVLDEGSESSGDDDAAMGVPVETGDGSDEEDYAVVVSKVREGPHTPPTSPTTGIKIGPPTRASEYGHILIQLERTDQDRIEPGTQRAIKSTPFKSLPVFEVEKPGKKKAEVKLEEGEISSLDFEILRPPTNTPSNPPNIPDDVDSFIRHSPNPTPKVNSDREGNEEPTVKVEELVTGEALQERLKKLWRIEDKVDEVFTDGASPARKLLESLLDLVQDVKGLVGDHLTAERTKKISTTKEEYDGRRKEAAVQTDEVEAKEGLTEGDQSIVPRPNTPFPGQEPVAGYDLQNLVTPEELEARVAKAEDEMREHMWMQHRKETEDNERWTQLESRLAVLEVEGVGGGRWREPRVRRRTGNRTPASPPKNQVRKLEGRIQRMEGAWHDLPSIRSRLGRVEEQVEMMEEIKKGEETTERRLDELDNQIKPIRSYVAEHNLRQDLLSRAAFSGKGLLSAGLLPRVTKLENFRQEVAYRLVTLEEQLILRDRLIGAFWLTFVAPSHTEAVIRANTLRAVWDAATKHYTARMENLGGAIANREANAAISRPQMMPFVPTFDTSTPTTTDNTPTTML